MVLQNYLTQLILSYARKYLRNIEANLNLSLWGGDVVLNNLDLRLDVLQRELGVPREFKFSRGFIKELRIHIPWTALTFKPVEVTLTDVECVLNFNSQAKPEDEPEEQIEEDVKEEDEASTATAAAVATAPKLEAAEANEVGGSSWAAYLIDKILANVTIRINGLSFSFVEDLQSQPPLLPSSSPAGSPNPSTTSTTSSTATSPSLTSFNPLPPLPPLITSRTVSPATSPHKMPSAAPSPTAAARPARKLMLSLRVAHALLQSTNEKFATQFVDLEGPWKLIHKSFEMNQLSIFLGELPPEAVGATTYHKRPLLLDDAVLLKEMSFTIRIRTYVAALGGSSLIRLPYTEDQPPPPSGAAMTLDMHIHQAAELYLSDQQLHFLLHIIQTKSEMVAKNAQLEKEKNASLQQQQQFTPAMNVRKTAPAIITASSLQHLSNQPDSPTELDSNRSSDDMSTSPSSLSGSTAHSQHMHSLSHVSPNKTIAQQQAQQQQAQRRQKKKESQTKSRGWTSWMWDMVAEDESEEEEEVSDEGTNPAGVVVNSEGMLVQMARKGSRANPLQEFCSLYGHLAPKPELVICCQIPAVSLQLSNTSKSNPNDSTFAFAAAEALRAQAYLKNSLSAGQNATVSPLASSKLRSVTSMLVPFATLHAHEFSLLVSRQLELPSLTGELRPLPLIPRPPTLSVDLVSVSLVDLTKNNRNRPIFMCGHEQWVRSSFRFMTQYSAAANASTSNLHELELNPNGSLQSILPDRANPFTSNPCLHQREKWRRQKTAHSNSASSTTGQTATDTSVGANSQPTPPPSQPMPRATTAPSATATPSSTASGPASYYPNVDADEDQSLQVHGFSLFHSVTAVRDGEQHAHQASHPTDENAPITQFRCSTDILLGPTAVVLDLSCSGKSPWVEQLFHFLDLDLETGQIGKTVLVKPNQPNSATASTTSTPKASNSSTSTAFMPPALLLPPPPLLPSQQPRIVQSLRLTFLHALAAVRLNDIDQMKEWRADPLYLPHVDTLMLELAGASVCHAWQQNQKRGKNGTPSGPATAKSSNENTHASTGTSSVQERLDGFHVHQFCFGYRQLQYEDDVWSEKLKPASAPSERTRIREFNRQQKLYAAVASTTNSGAMSTAHVSMSPLERSSSGMSLNLADAFHPRPLGSGRHRKSDSMSDSEGPDPLSSTSSHGSHWSTDSGAETDEEEDDDAMRRLLEISSFRVDLSIPAALNPAILEQEYQNSALEYLKAALLQHHRTRPFSFAANSIVASLMDAHAEVSLGNLRAAFSLRHLNALFVIAAAVAGLYRRPLLALIVQLRPRASHIQMAERLTDALLRLDLKAVKTRLIVPAVKMETFDPHQPLGHLQNLYPAAAGTPFESKKQLYWNVNVGSVVTSIERNGRRKNLVVAPPVDRRFHAPSNSHGSSSGGNNNSSQSRFGATGHKLSDSSDRSRPLLSFTASATEEVWNWLLATFGVLPLTNALLPGSNSSSSSYSALDSSSEADSAVLFHLHGLAIVWDSIWVDLTAFFSALTEHMRTQLFHYLRGGASMSPLPVVESATSSAVSTPRLAPRGASKGPTAYSTPSHGPAGHASSSVTAPYSPLPVPVAIPVRFIKCLQAAKLVLEAGYNEMMRVWTPLASEASVELESVRSQLLQLQLELRNDEVTRKRKHQLTSQMTAQMERLEVVQRNQASCDQARLAALLRVESAVLLAQQSSSLVRAPALFMSLASTIAACIDLSSDISVRCPPLRAFAFFAPCRKFLLSGELLLNDLAPLLTPADLLAHPLIEAAISSSPNHLLPLVEKGGSAVLQRFQHAANVLLHALASQNATGFFLDYAPLLQLFPLGMDAAFVHHHPGAMQQLQQGAQQQSQIDKSAIQRAREMFALMQKQQTSQHGHNPAHANNVHASISSSLGGSSGGSHHVTGFDDSREASPFGLNFTAAAIAESPLPDAVAERKRQQMLHANFLNQLLVAWKKHSTGVRHQMHGTFQRQAANPKIEGALIDLVAGFLDLD